MKTIDRDRVIDSGTISGLDFTRFANMGVTPYHYDRNGVCSLVEVTRKNLPKLGFQRVYLLTPDEYNKISVFTENVNELAALHQKHIELLKDMVAPILVDKIMK